MSISVLDSEMEDRQSDDYLMEAAIILKRMVPSLSFSNKMALVCAGADHDRVMSSDLGTKLSVALSYYLFFKRQGISNNPCQSNM